MTTALRPKEDVESGQYTRTAAATTLGADYDIVANDPALSVPAGRSGRPCRLISVAIAGTIVVTGVDGVDVPVPSGIMNLPGQYTKIKASGTTAQGIVVFW